jgi:ribosomal protein L19E
MGNKLKYNETENWNRNVRTIAEHAKKFPMTRKVDKTEYEDLGTCIRSDQVPAEEIAEIFTDKAFYKWYKKKYWSDK